MNAENILQNNINPKQHCYAGSILQNIVNPTEYCYESE